MVAYHQGLVVLLREGGHGGEGLYLSAVMCTWAFDKIYIINVNGSPRGHRSIMTELGPALWPGIVDEAAVGGGAAGFV